MVLSLYGVTGDVLVIIMLFGYPADNKIEASVRKGFVLDLETYYISSTGDGSVITLKRNLYYPTLNMSKLANQHIDTKWPHTLCLRWVRRHTWVLACLKSVSFSASDSKDVLKMSLTSNGSSAGLWSSRPFGKPGRGSRSNRPASSSIHLHQEGGMRGWEKGTLS